MSLATIIATLRYVEWLALYALRRVSAFFAPNLSLVQPGWFIDRVNGSASNDGSLMSPIDSATSIRQRWTNGLRGVRPQIGNVASITITLLNESPTQPDVLDPWSTLLDVDFSTNTVMILTSATQPVALSGVLASATVFARNSTQGQIQITDAAVADFSPFVPTLFHDKTTGAIAWAYEPRAASPIGIVSKGKAALTPGVSVFAPADVGINTTDAYEFLTLPRMYLGTGSNTRQFPKSGALGAEASVFIYRLWCTSQGGGIFGDIWQPKNSGSFLNGVGVFIKLYECRMDQGWQPDAGVFGFYNCGHAQTSVIDGVAGPACVFLVAGFSYRGVQVGPGAVLNVGADFLIDGNAGIIVGHFATVFMDSFSRWGVGRAITMDGGKLHIQGVFGGPVVTYGTVGPSNPVIFFTTDDIPSAVDILAPASSKMQWDSNVTNWAFPVGSSGNNGWGFNQATGRYCGASDGVPTTNTWAHLDAAINAPGFGGWCVDPQSMCVVKTR
jgi:hypothetical protein